MHAMRALPLIDLAGSHREIGRGFGEQLRDATREYSATWLESAARRSGIDREALLARVPAFDRVIEEYAPHLAEEIRGVAEGAAIPKREAFAIQIRMELRFAGLPEPSCTTFALTGDRTAGGETLVGQNVDLDADVERFGVVVRMRPPEGPALLMYTSPGLIGYVGLNDAGLAVHGNLLVSLGWRAGFPRYLITRLMLAETSVWAALEAARRPPLASSRNLILGDTAGVIADAEMTPALTRVLGPDGGAIVHTNHFLAPDLAGTDRYVPQSSHHRLDRMRGLIAATPRPRVEDLKVFFRDHDRFPGAICAHPDAVDGIKTVASLISEPAAGRLHATWGSPCEAEYHTYSF